MKKLFIYLLIFIFGISYSNGQKPFKKIVVITVSDKKVGKPIDNAIVTLTTIVEARDVFREIQHTNTKGQCTFAFNYNPSADYSVFAAKEGYLGYLENDPVKMSKSDARITRDSEKNISLFLTSDSMNQVEFYRKFEERYEIPELLALFKSGKFHGGIPLLCWNDIPDLLAAGEDTTLISSFPTNPLSSSIMEAPLGMVALWMIESIRISEGNRFILPFEKYPSLNPAIYFSDNRENAETDAEKQGKTYEAYRKWWEDVKKMDANRGCKIDPFDGTNLVWQ